MNPINPFNHGSDKGDKPTAFSKRDPEINSGWTSCGKKEKIPQLVGQIPWRHIRLILDKIDDAFEAEFYIRETIKNNWSRLTLERQIKRMSC